MIFPLKTEPRGNAQGGKKFAVRTKVKVPAIPRGWGAWLQMTGALAVNIVVCWGLTTLSTIFQSYHDGDWLRQGAHCSLL